MKWVLYVVFATSDGLHGLAVRPYTSQTECLQAAHRYVHSLGYASSGLTCRPEGWSGEVKIPAKFKR